MGRREEREDDESTVTISFPHDPQQVNPSRHRQRDGGGERSLKQADQLARAREIALNNRRVKTRARLEEKLSQLKLIMGDLNNDQLERTVKLLIETEDRHRSKQAALTESLTEQLKKVYEEIHKVRKDVEKATSKRVRTLSDVRSVSASVRG